MAVKSILVPLDGTETTKSAMETAFMVGRDAGAHVDVFHVRADPKHAVPLLGEGMSGAMIEEMIELAETEAEDRATKSRRLFDEYCQEHSVPIVEEAPGPGGVSATWIEETGREDEAMARRGRVTDLIVVGRPTPDTDVPTTMTLNAALFETGRPVLVAPPQVPPPFGKRISIAWNTSAEAARAVAGAKPFITEAESVTVLIVEAPRTPLGGAEELAAYLAWHGVEATVRVVVPGDRPPRNALLQECGEAGDMLVMGAYTQGRVRQMLLGGFTRHVLAESTMPMLMAR